MASLVNKAKTQHIDAGFTEVIARGRGSITSRNPSTGKSVVSAAAGGVGLHFGDGPYAEAQEINTDWVAAEPADAPWLFKIVQAGYHLYFAPGNQEFDAGQIIKYVHPGSSSEITFQPQQLQWTNDINQIAAIGDPQAVTPIITGDRLEFADAFGSGLDFVWSARYTRLAKFLHISQLSDIGSPPQFIIDGGNPVLRLQFVFQKSANVDIYANGILWNEKSNNPQETTGNVEFRSGTETLWYFQKPVAFDGSTGEVPPPVIRQRLRATAQNLFVDVLIPWTWLQNAIYPVIIDPTVEENPQASGDDYYGDTGPGSLDTSTALMMLGYESGWTAVYCACRFPTVTITNGATIDTAYVNFDAWASDSSAGCNVSIWAVDEATPAAATTDGEVSADVAASTTATVAWSNIASWTEATNYNSAEIKTVIQELVDSYGATFGAGTAHVLLYFWDNSSTADSQRRGASIDDYKGYDAPLLHVEYSAGGATLTVNDAGVVTQADAPVLAQQNTIALQDTFVTTQADAPTLTQQNTITVQSAYIVVQSDAPILAQQNTITVQNTYVDTQSDAPVLTQSNTIVVQDGFVSTQADNVTLATLGALVVQDAYVDTQADNVTLTQANTLAVDDAYVDTQSDNVSLSLLVPLVVQDGYSTTQADNVTLTQANVLVVQDAYTITATDLFALTQASTVVVADTYVIAQADDITVSIPDQATVRAWNLQARDTTWTLAERDTTWTLAERDTAWSVKER